MLESKKKSQTLIVRVSERELKALELITEYNGTSKSDELRKALNLLIEQFNDNIE